MPHRPPALIVSTPQTLWGPPAVLNFTLGGLGAGFHVAATVLGDAVTMGLAAWLSPVLVLAGFAAVATEAGRPLRGLRVLRGVGTSWMSRELWLGGAFVLLALADGAAPSAALRLAAAAAATALVLAQGFMLTQARAIAAWSVPAMPAVFVASAALSGTALLLLAGLLAGRPPDPRLLVATMVALVGGLPVWLGYLGSSVDPAFLGATAPLRQGPVAVELVLAGYAVPFVLLALALGGASWAPAPTALGAILAIAAQYRAKSVLILAAGRRRPLTLATLTLPRRSS
jgi:anaerobic dimethyl sulfoxide reductase subunit C (anchor subunit)